MNEKFLKLYDYLKSNDLTDLDKDTFYKTYSTDATKSASLHSYLKENGMTDLDVGDFQTSYFGASPVKKKGSLDSKPVGSPIGSAVGEAAKMAAGKQEAPVVSPKLSSIVQKAQGASAPSAGSAVSGLGTGSPSISKSTSVSAGEAPKTENYWEVAKVLSDNSNKEFVQRMAKPDLKIKNEDGSVSTHKLSTANVDNKEIVFPTIVNVNGKLIDYSNDVEKALDFALENNEYISFDDPNKARQFAEGAWKSVAKDYNQKKFGVKPNQATSLEGTDFEIGAFSEPPGAERVKTREQFNAGESQARTALYDIQSGRTPSYVSANELEKVVKAGGLDEKQFADYQKESAQRYNTIKSESEKLEQEYLQNAGERLKAIADKDKEYQSFFQKTQAEVNQFAQTATSQQELDAFIAGKNEELNNVYEGAKERALKVLDTEIQSKFDEIYNKNMPGVDLIEKSGLKAQLDELTNDPNFDILSFDKKKDLLKSMYVTIGNSLAKKGMGDAATLLKLREQLDANYLNKFYVSKEQQFTPFALKQYAEQQLPEMEKKLNELNALYKKQQESGNMAGGYYTNEDTGEQMPTGEAIVKYKEAIRNLELIQEMPDQKGAGAFSDFIKGFSSVPLAEKTPFLSSLIGVGRTGSLYNSATKEKQNEADESLLRTEAMLQDYASQTSDQRSVWYDAGKSTAHSVPFMGEFIMTMGVGRTTVKGLETLAKKKIKDYGESKARKFLLKPLFETIGTVAQTAANPQQVALNTFERMTPEMQLVMSEEGDRLVSKVDQNTGEDFDEAFLKGFGVTWAEFFTERAGSAIPFYTKGLSGQLLPKSPEWVKRAFISLYMRKTGTNITQAYNKLKNVGWDGVLGEFGEEIFIMPLENIITGDYKDPRNGPHSSILNGIVDPKTGELDERNLKQIAISTTAMTLPMVGGGMIVSALPQNKTSIQMMDINGNTYQAELRNSILATIVAESKKKGNALAEFRDTKLPKMDLSMDEMYVANKVIDALENQNAQTRLGGGTLSEADAKLIAELDKLDLQAAAEESAPESAPEVVPPVVEQTTADAGESAPNLAASPEISTPPVEISTPVQEISAPPVTESAPNLAASPELVKAHEKGIADKGKTEVEEILEESTESGEVRKKSTEQRVLEGGKAAPEVVLQLIDQGVNYVEQSQALSRKVADKVVAAYKRKFGDNWKIELENALDSPELRDLKLGAIPAFLYDALITESQGIPKARLIKKLSDRLIDMGRFISAMRDIQLNNPESLYEIKKAQVQRDILLGLGFKDGKAVNPKSQIGKIQAAQKQMGEAKKDSIKEAAAKVTSRGEAKKGALSPEKRKERGKKKVDEALSGLKDWLTNPKMSAKMDLNDLYENQKEFNGLIIKLADGLFYQGVANAAQLVTKMKEALSQLGIDGDSFDTIKDRFLADFDLENKLMDQRREEGSEKLAKKIVNLVKQPKKKEFDPVKQMVETLFGKVKETVVVPNKPRATAEEKIQEALANFYEYREVWEQSQDEVIDQINELDISDAQKQAMIAKLAEYLGSELSVPFGEKLAKSALAERYAEKQINSMLDLMDSMGVDLFNVTDEILERFAFSVGIESDAALDLFRKLLNEKVELFKQKKATAKEKREEAKKIAKEARYKSQAERMAAKDNTPVWATRKKGVVKSVSNALEKGLGIFGAKATNKEQTLLGEFAKDLQKNIMRTLPKEKQDSKQDPIKTLLDAISNFDTYQDVLAETQATLAEKYADNPEALAIFDSYFSGITESSFIEKSASPIVKSALADKAKAQNKSTDKLIRETLLSANEIQAATREQFVSELVDKLRFEANLTASEARKIADEFYKEYDKLLEAKKSQILKQTIGADVKAKFARKPEHQRIMEAIKHGALDGKMIKVKNEKGEVNEYDSTYLFGEKYGIPDIYNPEIQETLKAFTEAIVKLPANSVQRKIVEREFNTYLDYLKGESKNLYQTLTSLTYSNLLFSYVTWASIIVSNFHRLFFDSFIKIGRKLIFETGRAKDLGLMANMLAKGMRKSTLSAKGILLNDTMREGSKVGKSEILRIKAKYTKNKFLRNYFKFEAYSNRVMESLDALVTVAMTDVEVIDLVLDRLNAENKLLKKEERLSNKDLRDYAYEIMGMTKDIRLQAEEQATDEFKKQYGDDFEMKGRIAVLWKQRVDELQKEIGLEQVNRAGTPDWYHFVSEDLQELYEQAAKKGQNIGMIGPPAGTMGLVSSMLEKFIKNIIGLEAVVKFLNAGMNSAVFVLKSSPLGIIPVMKYYATSKRGIGVGKSSDKTFEKYNVRREMYGYGGRVEKREELLTWLFFQSMTSVMLAAMFGEQAIAIVKSMFGGDDDDPEKTQNLGQEGRELYFGKNMDGKSGKWKEGLFVTGRMFGDSGNNWRKTQAFTAATGIEPNTVYYDGKKRFTYKNNPVLTATYGTVGVISDLLLFNDKMDDITQGFLFKVSASQLMITLDSSPMKGVSDLFNMFSMRKDVTNMSDDTYEKLIDNSIKFMSTQALNAFVPKFIKNIEDDFEGAMSQQDRIDLSWYELATRDWPIVNNLFDREIKYDHFGRPLLRKTKGKSILLGVPAIDVANGEFYSPVLFDVSNEGEVSSPFANSVRGGESAREYALFASKNSRAYLLPDGKVVEITGDGGEVKKIKMDKRQYNEFANKVSLAFGDFVRSEYESLSEYPSQKEYDKLVAESSPTPLEPFDKYVKAEKNAIIEAVLQEMFLKDNEKSFPIRLVTKEE